MNKRIGIVQINDTHANILPLEDVLYTGEGFKVETFGGYPRIMTKVKEYRQKHNDNLLVLDNGDTFHGTYESIETKGQIMLPYLNALGINAMTFHWDAAYTLKHLKKLESKLNYPILAANIHCEKRKECMFKPTKMFEIDGVKIGVIGIASNILQSMMSERFWGGAEFTDSIEEARRYTKILRDEGADIIILLSHLGYPQDVDILNKVDGIDICLSGHTHNRIRFVEKVKDSYIIQSGALTSSIGYLELCFEDNELSDINHEYIVLDSSIEEDEDMLEMIDNDKILNDCRKLLDVEVGETLIDLHRGSSFYGTMDYFILDAVREVTGLDVAFSHGWRWGGAISKGKLTRKHLYQIVPMDPSILTAEITGREMFNMLEDNLENTFSIEPFKQMGGYIKRNSGLKVYWKIENPYGHRIQRVFVGNEDLDFDKTYKVAFITRQAIPEGVGKNHEKFGMHTVEAMEQLLRKGPYNREDLNTYIPV